MKKVGNGIRDYAIFQDFIDDEILKRNNEKTLFLYANVIKNTKKITMV